MGMKWWGSCIGLALLMAVSPARGDDPDSVFSTCDDGSPQVTITGDGISNDNPVKWCGRYAGEDNSVAVFQGIKYGDFGYPTDRFKYSSVIAPEMGQQSSDNDRKNFAAVCAQNTISQQFGNEDCLYLNIWAPVKKSANPDGYPVLVFVHGGAFFFGSSADGAYDVAQDGSITFHADGGLYDGSVLALPPSKGGVNIDGLIVVTINYRLGALGFMSYNPAADDEPWVQTAVPGNYGINDIVTALAWVDLYIGSSGNPNFGGSNAKIVLAGESAGAMATGLLNYSVPIVNKGISNGFKGISGIVMESNPMGVEYEVNTGKATDLPVHQAVASAYLKALCSLYITGKQDADGNPLACDDQTPGATNIKGMDWLTAGYDGYETYGVPTTEQMLKAQGQISGNSGLLTSPTFTNILSWTPFIDTSPAEPAAVTFANLQPIDGYAGGSEIRTNPVMYGTNRNEGVLFVEGTLGIAESTDYANIINSLFVMAGATDDKGGKAIMEAANIYYDGSTSHPYCPNDVQKALVGATCTSVKSALDDASQGALANFVTDYIFRCTNAQSAANSVDAGAYVQPYVFTGAPAQTLFGKADDACNKAPASDVSTLISGVPVCHGYELPWVFNTVSTVYKFPVTNLPDNAAETQLAMHTDWMNFVALATDGQTPTGGMQDLIIYGSETGHSFPPGGGADLNAALDAANCGPNHSLWTKTVQPK